MNPSRFLLLVAAVSGLLVSNNAASGEHQKWKSATYVSAWGPCPQGESCGSVWLMNGATQSIERKGPKPMASHKLSEGEWAELEALVGEARRQASSCPAPPTDVFETLEVVENDGSKHSVELTGCVFGEGTSAPKALANWLQRH